MKHDTNNKTEITTPEVLCVYYNSACPVCNTGIKYQKQRMQNCQITWKDVHINTEVAKESGSDLEFVRERLHVIDHKGELKIGIDAFITLWRKSPGENWKAALFSFPIVHKLSDISYNIFARCLYKINRFLNRWEVEKPVDDIDKSILALHMGASFNKLAPLLQQAHIGKVKLEGKANVQHGNWLAKIICRAFSFPHTGDDIHLRVDCDHSANSMLWNRNFEGQLMCSHFERRDAFLLEHLGPLALWIKAMEYNGELHYQFVKTYFLGIPLPGFLSPRIIASEREVNARYQFSVSVSMLLVGLVIAYGGELTVEQQS